MAADVSTVPGEGAGRTTSPTVNPGLGLAEQCGACAEPPYPLDSRPTSRGRRCRIEVTLRQRRLDGGRCMAGQPDLARPAARVAR